MTQKLKRKTITFKTLALLLALSMLIPLMPFRAIAATSEEDLTANETEQTTVSEKQTETPLDAIIVEEDVSKRGRNEKHFLCDDGSYIAISYSEDVHEIVNNEWVDIEYDVDESNDEISPADEDIKVKFANNTNSSKLVKFEADGYKISWTVEADTEDGEGINKVKLSKESKSAIKTTKDINKQNKEKIKAESKHTYAQVLSYKQMAELAIEKEKSADVENNEKVLYANASIEEYNRERIQSAASYAQSMVEYKDAFGEGLTLRYLLTLGKINEEIVLDSYSGFKSYSMVINTDGLTPVVSENGSVALTDSEGNAVMNIAAPYMYDAVDAISENVSVTATQENKKEWRITYTPDQEWLKDTNRVYPVVIDPSVTTQSYAQSALLDNYVYSGQTTAVNNSSPYLYVGYDGNSTESATEYITYWGSSNHFPSYIDPDAVVDVHLYFRLHSSYSASNRLTLYHTGDYSINTSTLTWNNKPSFSTSYGYSSNTTSNNWFRFSSYKLVNDANDSYDASVPIGIYAIKQQRRGSGEPTIFYSSDYRPYGGTNYIPYIEVVYTGDSAGGGDSGGDSGESSEPTLVYPENYTTEIESGTYIIESKFNGRYLHHTDGNNTVNVWNYSEQPYQKWNIQKNSDGTYRFGSQSTVNPNLSMEVYYGQNNESQPITMYNYQDSNAYKFFIIKNTDNSYSIMPALSGDKVITVFSGTNYDEYYGTSRKFNKIHGQSVELSRKIDSDSQKWYIRNINQFDWDTSLETGTYTIESKMNQKLLTSILGENIACVMDASYDSNSETIASSSQRWNVVKVDNSGIYVFSPVSYPTLDLELYYASISGACNDGHVFTLYDYEGNTSPYIRMRLKKSADGYYSIYPLVTPTKCICVYDGANTTYTFNSRTFQKVLGESIHLNSSDGGTSREWKFEPVVGIMPQNATMNIGDTFDLDTIEAFPQTSTTLNWTLVSGAPNVEYNSETNEVLAEKVGTAVFQTLLSDGLYYQFTITIPESRPIPDGYYYIDNFYSQKRIDIGAVNSGGNATLCQQSPNNKSKSQMWYVEYAGSSMYYIYSVSSYRKAINFNATPTANDLAYPLEVNTPAHNYSSWFIVPSNNSQTYTLLTSANTRKSLGVDLDGTTLVAQNRVYGNNHQEWFFIPVQNKPAAEAQIIAVGETVTGTIENVKDFEWYKVIVPGSSKYQIKIDPDMDEDFTSKNYYLEIYSGDSTNPTNLEKMLYTHTGDQLCTIASNSMTESKTYYIKVYPKKNINDTIANVFSIMVSNAPVEGGSEIEGWIYRGAYMSPKILYYVDSSMDTIWRGEDSYRTLFMEAIERWNTALSGFTGNEDVFDVTESVSTTKVSLEDAEGSWDGLNDQETGEIILNYNSLKDYTRQNIVDVIAHELGHTLGLGDLYISQEYGYIYNGQILDNSDHLMYGLGSENLTTSIYGRFHDDDITGVRAIQGNSLSLVKYTEEELYESANFIVKGKVVSTAPYNSRYTRVNFLVEEYLYSQQTVNESIISFLHLGTPEEEYYVSPLYNSGEEYILYLHYDLYDELFVVGGPQGRFLVEEDESGEKTATNQIDRIVEKEAKEIYKLEKKFAKELEKFEKQAKTKAKDIKANKKQ